MFFPNAGGYVPPDRRSPRMVPLDEWWEQVVYIVGPGNAFTRRELVLTAADTDGGAHVDEEVTSEYERLASLWRTVLIPNIPGVAIDSVETHLIGLRQFGYEILNSTELIEFAGLTTALPPGRSAASAPPQSSPPGRG